MPAALAMHQREAIIKRRQQGESFAAIARSLRISYGAVRNIYHRYRETGQLPPGYDRCRHTAIRKQEAIYQQAVSLKQAHPGWGAGLIWTELVEDYAEDELPSVRTLQRWFRRANVQSSRPDQRPQTRVQRGKYPHEVWALDAKEETQLGDGSHVSWLTVTDEGSGAILETFLFPHQKVGDRRSASGQDQAPTDPGLLGSSGEDQDG